MSVWLTIILMFAIAIVEWISKLFLDGFMQKAVSIFIAPFVIIVISLIYCYCLVAFFDVSYQMANKAYASGIMLFVGIIAVGMTGALSPKKYKKDGEIDRRYKSNPISSERVSYLFFLLIWLLSFYYLMWAIFGVAPLELFAIIFGVK